MILDSFIWPLKRAGEEGGVKMEDYEKTYEEFWKPLVENPDGTLNIDQIKRELHDFYFQMENTPKVFMHVTGDKVSKPNTFAEVVISLADELREEEIEEAVQNALQSEYP